MPRTAEARVHLEDRPPGTAAVSAALADALGGLETGDQVDLGTGPLTVVEVRAGAAPALWCAGAPEGEQPVREGARAADRLRAWRSACEVPDGEGWESVHHTPVHGVPLPAAGFDWLRRVGAAGVIADVAWRQDHPDLSAVALHERWARRRPGPAWRWRQDHPKLGAGRIRDGMAAMAFALGFELRVREDGVHIGLWHRRPAKRWSSGEPGTSAAFREGGPAEGGIHDPRLVGTPLEPRFAHVTLPWRMLPAHLAPWVADLVDRPAEVLLREAAEHGTDALAPDLDRALEARLPRPVSLDGKPLVSRDFLWAEVPVVPMLYRQPRRSGGGVLPHGLDGPLHGLISIVRHQRKLGRLEPALEAELRARVQARLDAYLGVAPTRDGDWGWGAAMDLRETLRFDGAMLDWGGQAVAVVERRRERVGIPPQLAELLLTPERPEAVLLVRMPDAVCVVRPERTDGPILRLPTDVARTLGARTGDLLRVAAAVSAPAQAELESLADGVRLTPLAELPGWLDRVAAARGPELGPLLAEAARDRAVDPCAGPVGRRAYAGFVPPARGTPDEEVDAVHRFWHLVDRWHGADARARAGASPVLLREVQAGGSWPPDVLAVWAAHDGQAPDGAWLLADDGTRWRLRPLDVGAAQVLTLAVSQDGRTAAVHRDGSVRLEERLLAWSPARWLLSALLQGHHG